MRLHHFLPAAVMLCGSLAARADTVYTYVGQDFTVANGPYTTSDSVSGSFTVPTPIDMNSHTVFDPTSFSFTDGVQTITSNNATSVYFSGQGSSVDGEFNLFNIRIAIGGNTIILAGEGPGYGNDEGQLSTGDDGFNDEAGTFTLSASPAATPEPSSVALLVTGMLGVAGVVRRRFARA